MEAYPLPAIACIPCLILAIVSAFGVFTFSCMIAFILHWGKSHSRANCSCVKLYSFKKFLISWLSVVCMASPLLKIFNHNTNKKKDKSASGCLQLQQKRFIK